MELPPGWQTDGSMYHGLSLSLVTARGRSTAEVVAWLPAAKLSVGRKKLAATTLHDTTVLFGGGFKSGVEPAGYRASLRTVSACRPKMSH